jgi:hypothetical protein
VLAATNNDGDVTRSRIARDLARSMKAIQARHHYIHQNQLRWLRLDFQHCRFGVIRSSDAVTVPTQQVGDEMALGR